MGRQGLSPESCQNRVERKKPEAKAEARVKCSHNVPLESNGTPMHLTLDLLFIFMCIGVLPWVSGPPELTFQTVVNCCVGAGN